MKKIKWENFLLIFILIFSCNIPNLKKGEKTFYEFCGIIREKRELEGTLSEYKYFVLEDENGEEKIIFNEKLNSLGFELYIDRKVNITGTNGIGYVGWQRIKYNGVIVREIILLDK